MTANNAGAVSNESREWHSLNWGTIHREVKQLQIRIVKATKAGKLGKAKSLQFLLTRSFSGRALAVKRVTENSGRRTSGVDKVLWDTPAGKVSAIKYLKRRGYKPLPLKRVYIPKGNSGKKRPLGIPTMKDRAMQALYLLALEPIAECQADYHSYGFRKGRSTADAIEQCFVTLAKRMSPKWILEGDIRGCFDNIEHSWLLKHIQMDRNILQKWLKAGFIDKNAFYKTISGTPQGGLC